MLSSSEKNAVTYWDSKPAILSRDINNIRDYKRSKFVKPCWLKGMVKTALNFVRRNSELCSSDLCDFLDQVAKTEFTDKHFLNKFHRIKPHVAEFKEAIALKPQNAKEESWKVQTLRKLNRNLIKINLQLEANDLLKKGYVKEFNELKKQNPNVQLYIRDITIKNRILEDLDLTGCVLDNVVFTNSPIKSLKAQHTIFNNCKFQGKGSLSNSNISKCYFGNCELENASIEEVTFSQTRFEGLKLNDSKMLNSKFLDRTSLREIELDQSSISDSQFTEAEIQNLRSNSSSIDGSLIENSRLVGCDLLASSLSGTKISKTNLNDFTMRNCLSKSKALASFEDCHLDSLSIKDSKIQNFNILRSTLNKAVVEDSEISSSKFENTKFKNSMLQRFDLKGSKFNNVEFNASQIKTYKDSKKKALDTAPAVEMKQCKFIDSAIDDAKLVRFKISDSVFQGSKLSDVEFVAQYMNDIKFNDCDLSSIVFSFGTPEGQGIEFHESNKSECEFKHPNLTIEEYTQYNVRIPMLRNPRTSSAEKRKILFSYPDGFDELSPSEIIKHSGVSKSYIKRLDPELKTTQKECKDKADLINRLHIIHRIKLLANKLAPPAHYKKMNHSLQKILYESALKPAQHQKSVTQSIVEESKSLQEFTDESCAEIADSFDESIDYLLVPRILELYPDIDLKKITTTKLDKVTRFLQPYLALAIIQFRESHKIPKSAAYKFPSLLLHFSKDFHQDRTNFSGSIRDFAPQGGWKQVLDQEEKFVTIKASDGKEYKVVNLLSSSDFKMESDVLGHCIGRGMTYVNRASNGNYHYFSIQDAETGSRVSTLELEMSGQNQPSRYSSVYQIAGTPYAFRKGQNQGSVRNYRRAGIGDEIAKKFLKQIQDGAIKIKTPNFTKLGDSGKARKLSNFENHIGTVLGEETESGWSPVRRIMRLAWSRLARPDHVFLDDKFGEEDPVEKLPVNNDLDIILEKHLKQARKVDLVGRVFRRFYSQGEVEVEKQKLQELTQEVQALLKAADKPLKISHERFEGIKSTQGVGSYKQAKDAPFNNYFIPNEFRGQFVDNQFKALTGRSSDEDGIDEGINRFLSTDIPGWEVSLDDMIKKALVKYKVIQAE